MGSIYLTEVDPQKAMRSKGAFGQKWREAKLKATRALDQQTDLASFSSYRPEVVKYLSMVWLQKGSVLWAEGDISDDCFYYVVAGFCDVIQGQDEKQHVVRRLGAGATFGDIAVRAEFEATRGRRTAGITAASDVAVLKLSGIDYLHVTGEYTDRAVAALRCKPTLRNVQECRMLENVFARCTVFGSEHTSTFSARLARACTLRTVGKNEVLFRQGDPASKFYIIVQGYVRVVVDGELVGCLGPGTMFGEAGVKGGTPEQRRRTASVIGGFVTGVEGSPSDADLATERETSRRKRVIKLGPNATGTVFEDAHLAEVDRKDFLRITSGTTESIQAALSIPGKDRTDEQFELLFELLRDTSFFKFLASPVLQKQCCRKLNLRVCERDEAVFEVDELGDMFYIIVRGAVTGRIPGQPSFELSSGAAFGEIAVVGETEEDRRRSATIRCEEDSVFATLSRADYLHITGGLEHKALEALTKDPGHRTKEDLDVLVIFFQDTDFFRKIGFPALQRVLVQVMTVRPVDRRQFAAAADGEEAEESEPLYREQELSDGRVFFLLRGRLIATENGVETHQHQQGATFCDIGDVPSVPMPGQEDEKKAAEADESIVCTQTVYAVPPAAGEDDTRSVLVRGCPQSWQTADLYQSFKDFGDIAKVAFLTKRKARASERARQSHSGPSLEPWLLVCCCSVLLVVL